MTLLTRYEPFTGRLDGLFDELFRPAFIREGAAEALPLRIDVREGAEAYTVLAEIPGVKREEIAVEIDGNEVSIAAEARRAPAPEGEKWLRVERFVGRTARRFALPQEIDEARSAARFADGVLELTLPKKAAAASRKIQVQ